MDILFDKDKSGELLSFEIELFRSFSLIFQNQIINMSNAFNCIYIYRQTIYLQSILKDIEVIKGTRSFTNIDKWVYEYKASNIFKIRDQLIILDKSSKPNRITLPELSPLEGQKVIYPKLIASNSVINKSVCPKQYIPLFEFALTQLLFSNTTSHT